ncbi:MAG: DUF3168 domain-containing protein [Pseudomonadota bacterium]
MSYAVSAALQGAIYAGLTTDPGVTSLVGAAIYDAIPAGTLPSLYITLGPESVSDASDKSGAGAVHKVVVTVVSETPAFAAAKDVAAAVCDALLADLPALSRGRLVSLTFEKATAGRIDGAAGRKIDLTFRARVEDN